MPILSIYVGPPENDKKVSVSDEKTVSQILEENSVAKTGMIQHNGRTLNSNQLNKSLASLGFVEDDSLHVVRKMDGARG